MHVLQPRSAKSDGAVLWYWLVPHTVQGLQPAPHSPAVAVSERKACEVQPATVLRKTVECGGLCRRATEAIGCGPGQAAMDSYTCLKPNKHREVLAAPSLGASKFP